MNRDDADSVQDPGKEAYSVVKMGTDHARLTCTHGKITAWFGRKASPGLVGRILIGISRVDSSAHHDLEVLLPFEEIEELEGQGYVLVSYARKEGKYRATFMVPFSQPKALRYLAESILEELEYSDVRKGIMWNGSDARFHLLNEELSDIDGWSFEVVERREGEE